MIDGNAPCACSIGIKIGTSSPHILHRTLYSVGAIVKHTLSKQLPSLLCLDIDFAIASSNIICHPSLEVGFRAIHPGQRVNKVVGHRRLLYRLGGGTYAFNGRVFTFVMKIIIGQIVQTPHHA